MFFKKVLSLFLVFFISLILIEGTSALCSHFNLIPINRPAYTTEISNQSFSQDMHPVIGTWHYPLISVRHKRGCIDVVYQTNSVGSRDKERDLKSNKNRTIVLGDSFIEGYGLKSKQRLSNLLESLTGNEYLNFGVSGTGPLHYLLVYQEMASHFTHNAIMIGILPDNDFLDLDPEFGRKYYGNRFRPYLVGEFPNFQIKYFRKNLHPEEQGNQFVNLFYKIKSVLRGYTYTYGALRFAWEKYKGFKYRPQRDSYSGYYDFTQQQWQRLAYVLKEFKKRAKDKKIIVFTIPTLRDFTRNPTGLDTPLAYKMKQLSKKLNFEYIDLFPDMAKKAHDPMEYFISCNPHWNFRGNEAAANIVFKKSLSQIADLQ